ncbi:MAG: universal stress protein [Gemmatimonadetes bacterium]|nr:universal stress protein [Gemmatimonadota bacterium]
MSRNILVPLDGSGFAEHALAAAIGLARASDGQLHIVQVHEVPFMPLPPESIVRWDSAWDDSLREREQAYLRSLADRVVERTGLAVRTQLIDGDPAYALGEYAREAAIDLIVMTTHGRGGLSRWWLGSVAGDLARNSHTPVLLLRPGEQELDLGASLNIRHVLVPLDGSGLARDVLEPATWLGSLSGACYTLLTVTLPSPPVTQPFMIPEVWADQKTIDAEQLRTAAELGRIAARLRKKGFDVQAAVEPHMTPARAILEYARTHDVDVIAIATNGRSGIARFALGSVADKVVRGADRPVLLFRPQTREVDEPAARMHDSGGGVTVHA